MVSHSVRRAIPAMVVLFCFSSISLAQSSVSGRNSNGSAPRGLHAGNTANAASQSAAAPNPGLSPSVLAFRREVMASSKAQQEGRLLEAERLLNTAITMAERKPSLRSNLGSLLKNLAQLEYGLHDYRQAIATEQRAVAADEAPGSGATSSQVFWDLNQLTADAMSSRHCATAAQAASQQLALARRHPGRRDFQLLLALGGVAMADQCEHRFAEGRKVQAEAVRICQAQPEPHSAGCVSILARYYYETGHPGYAEKLLAQKAARTPDSSPRFRYDSYLPKASQLQALARMYKVDHLYGQAVATDRRAISVVQRTAKHPVDAAPYYDSLGSDLEKQGQDAEAEAVFKHSFDLQEHATGRFRKSWIRSLGETPLVSFYERQGLLSDAADVLEQVLAVQQSALNPNDAAIAHTLVRLADVESRLGEYSEAEPLCQHALKIQEADYGSDSFHLVRTLSIYAGVERHLHNTAKANALAARAAALRKKTMPNSRPASPACVENKRQSGRGSENRG